MAMSDDTSTGPPGAVLNLVKTLQAAIKGPSTRHGGLGALRNLGLPYCDNRQDPKRRYRK